LLTAWAPPAEFLEGGILVDVTGFAQTWVDRVAALDAAGERPAGIELVSEPDATAVPSDVYGALALQTRAALDAAGFADVRIAGPGTATLLGAHDARDRVLAFGKSAPVDVWSFHAGDDGLVCSGGAGCLAAGWREVLTGIELLGAPNVRPVWATRLASHEVRFADQEWPSPDDRVDFNATWSVGYAVRTIEAALASIQAGAERVYLWHAVDGKRETSRGGGWGILAEDGSEKPIFVGLELVVPPLANGAQVLEAPDQTGRPTYAAAFVTDTEVHVIVTNEIGTTVPFRATIANCGKTAQVESGRGLYRLSNGDPSQDEPDLANVYTRTVTSSTDDGGNLWFEVDLLPYSATLVSILR
jgi:hypothetical protein